MAGVGFYDQPDNLARGEAEGTNRAGRDVHLEGRAGFHAEGDQRAAGLERFNDAGKNVPGAQKVRRFGGEKNVSRSNSHANFAPGCGIAEGNLDLASRIFKT